MKIDSSISLTDLKSELGKFWDLSGQKIISIENEFDSSRGAPVFTSEGKYTSRGWTEWTQGFQYGSAILQFDATGNEEFLNIGRTNTLKIMTPHISHTGVHDHGFNNISTYGNLLRLMNEGKIEFSKQEKYSLELALKLSASVQASRWTKIKDGGFIYSFNGPHSLFVDTIRTCRVLVVGHKLGHYLPAENDIKISLLDRALRHIQATAKYSVYYGEGRDYYDIKGRTAHEAVFNINDGNFRCPNSQQGYSGFTTWTRGLAWAILGFAEQLEVLSEFDEIEFELLGGKQNIVSLLLKASLAVSDFYINNTPVDGIPYWDTGAPLLNKLDDYLVVPANPYNDYEPVDSSAAAIAAQGLARLGKYLTSQNKVDLGKNYFNAGLNIFKRLLESPYLSVDSDHQGLLLHSIYHRPNNWDYIPPGSKIPNGESSMWGDYHLRELALYLQRILNNEAYYSYIGSVK